MSEVSATIYSFDVLRENAFGAEAPEANAPAFVERRFMRFDIDGLETRHQKLIKSIFPIGTVPEDSEPVYFQWGAVDHAGRDDFEWGPKRPYDSRSEGQLDYKAEGRYLALRIEYSGIHYVRIVGMDLEGDVKGSRG